MCTLGHELDQYVPEKSLNDSDISSASLKNVPVIQEFDSFKISTIIDNTLPAPANPSSEIAYYGKNPIVPPASQLSSNEYTQSLEYYCPVGIIYDIEQLYENKLIKRVYPFDPSDFKVSLNGKSVDAFQIDNSIEGIRKYIFYFYGSLANYQYGESNPPSNAPSIIVDQVSRIQRKDTVTEAQLTISLILENPFDYLTYAACIILPEKLMANNNFSQLTLKDTNICIKTYPIYRGRIPSQYNTIVEQLGREFIAGQGDCYLQKKYHPDHPGYCTKTHKGACVFHELYV